jgi:hypothetical protein
MNSEATTSTSWSQPGEPAATRVQRYEGTDQDDTFRLFGDDARRAARAGYEAVAHTWEGSALVVTYKFRGVPKPTSRWRGLSRPALGILAGGAFMAIATLLPWATLADASGAIGTRSGIEGYDGLAMIVIGLGIAIFGRTMVRGDNTQRASTTLISSVLSLVFIVADSWNISQSAGTPGVGLVICGLGAVLAGLSSLSVRVRARRA